MKKQTKQAIDKLNQVIDDYINIFDSNKKEIKENYEIAHFSVLSQTNFLPYVRS